MASIPTNTYIVDPIGTDTSTAYIKGYLGYSYIEKVGNLNAHTAFYGGGGSAKSLWLGWAYNYSFSGTWPSSVKLTVSGQAVAFFNEPPKCPYSTVSVFRIALATNKETLTDDNSTSFCNDCYVTFKPSTGTSQSDNFGLWWVLTPFKGNVTRTFSLDSTTSAGCGTSVSMSFRTNIWSYAGLAGTLTTSTGDTTGNIVFSYPKPSMTLSASNISTASVTINIKNHTNPLSYWRYCAQWKLSSSSTWSSGSTFELTSSTSTRSLNTLTAGETYNYRFAYIDRNSVVVAYSNTLTFTVPADQATVYINYGGTVKKAKVWYNNGGTVKKVKNIYYNNSGTIKNVKK